MVKQTTFTAAAVGLALAFAAGCGNGSTPPTSPSGVPARSAFLMLEGGSAHPLLRGQTRHFTSDETVFWAGVDCYENHIEVRVGQELAQWTVVLGAPRGARLTAGTYDNATTYPVNLFSSVPGIRIGGEGRGCDDTGRFVITEARYLPSGAVERFHATFEHRCERFPDVLRGEVSLVNPPGAQVSCR